jgi:hypothetical protein
VGAFASSPAAAAFPAVELRRSPLSPAFPPLVPSGALVPDPGAARAIRRRSGRVTLGRAPPVLDCSGARQPGSFPVPWVYSGKDEGLFCKMAGTQTI